jgi:hypothetical protein
MLRIWLHYGTPLPPIDFLHNLRNKALRSLADLQDLENKWDNLQDLPNKRLMGNLERRDAQSGCSWILFRLV